MVIIVCYVAMALLILLQYYTNDKISALRFTAMKLADKRIEFLSQIIKGIKTIKCRLLEYLFTQRIDATRKLELDAFSQYCDIKNICGAIYFNAGIIISALVFLLVDKNRLDLGKVFSTLALLSYIFNFSIMFSNLAMQELFSLSVFNQRIEEAISKQFDQNQELQSDQRY